MPNKLSMGALLLISALTLSGDAQTADARPGGAGSSSSGAASAATTMPGYERRLFRVRDGLPEGIVQTFAQTPDHFLWVGTTGGLVRFDGANFKVFNHENTPEFQENSVFTLLTARDGTLWIGMEGGGLLHYVHGEFHVYGTAEGLSDTFVRAVAQDRAGLIWVGTNHGLFRLRASASPGAPSFERMDGTAELPPLAVNAIHEDRKGRLWLGGSTLLALDHGRVSHYQLSGNSSRDRVKTLAETADGTVWAGTVSGLYKIAADGGRFQPVQHVTGMIRAMRQMRDGSVWMDVLGLGGMIYRLSARDELIQPTSLETDAVLNFFEDSEGSVWAGTQSGMVRFSQTPVSLIRLPDAGRMDFGSVFRDHSGDLWAGSANLYRIHDGVARIAQLPGVGKAPVRSVFEDRHGTFWAGTQGDGLYRIDGTRSHHFGTREGLANNFVRDMVEASDGSLWVGTDEGISHLQGQQVTSFGIKDGLAYSSIRCLLEDRHHDLWIGTDQGLSHRHGSAFVHDAATEAMRQEKIWSMHEDSDGTLWLGTRSNGLFRYRDGRTLHITKANGLPSNNVYQVLEDQAARLWLSGPTGVTIVDRRQMDALAAGQGHLTPTFVPVSDAGNTQQIIGGVQSAGAISPAGDVWLPSNRGIVHILPGSAAPEPAPALLLASVTSDGRPLPLDSPVDLSPGNHTLEIAYSPLALRSQNNLRFRYKLDGVDKEWVDAGTRRTAYYNSLPAGRFLFHVRTFVTNNPDAYSEVTLSVRQQPPFYRTWWFLLAASISLGSAVLGLYRLRIARLRREFGAVLEERNRLAREMHDTLLQGCTSVSAVLEAISSVESETGDGIRQHLVNCAREQIRTTINEARDAVWSLRQPADVQVPLAPMLRSMGQRIAEESGIPVETHAGAHLATLPQGVAREVVMVAREAAHNAILHAEPEKVTVRIRIESEVLTVTISDDGRGFDASDIALGQPSEGNKHFGLLGMHERASRIGGTLSVVSSPVSGTEVTVTVPYAATSKSKQRPKITRQEGNSR